MKYFLDTEFVEYGVGEPIHLLSIGIVSEDEREYYAQLHYRVFPKVSDWVARYVFPHLQHFNLAWQNRSCNPHSSLYVACYNSPCPWRSREDMKNEIKLFCDPKKYGKPEFWGYYADYDWVVLCQLFGSMMDLPKEWPMYCRDIKQLCDDVGNPQLPEQGKGEHHALADARWNKLAWEFLPNIGR